MIKKYKYNFDFFKWIKKTELVELNEINTDDDPVRPELDNEFRTSRGRKIFGLKYNNEILNYLYQQMQYNHLSNLNYHRLIF